MMTQHCCLDSFVIFQGVGSSIAKEAYSFFFIFQRGGGSGLPAPSLDPRMGLKLTGFIFFRNTGTDPSPF